MFNYLIFFVYVFVWSLTSLLFDFYYHGSAADVDDGFVFEEDAVLVFENVPLVEGAGEAWGVAEDELQCTFLVLPDGNDAVGGVDAGVGSHDGTVG